MVDGKDRRLDPLWSINLTMYCVKMYVVKAMILLNERILLIHLIIAITVLGQGGRN